jgi:hypothetical protein
LIDDLVTAGSDALFVVLVKLYGEAKYINVHKARQRCRLEGSGARKTLLKSGDIDVRQ